NLVAFRQKWYAKNKLQEFNKKNVAAELIQVKVKGETWYRLRVKGFKSEKEASRYATKVKKTLNLGSVWVTKG
ncbi:MAG: SPOR domain-containing protein, partial [Methylococcaceae bacterium]